MLQLTHWWLTSKNLIFIFMYLLIEVLAFTIAQFKVEQ